MAKYIKCDYCGKRINFGETVWTDCDAEVACCSTECYAKATGYNCKLDDESVDDCGFYVYDDEKRMAEIKEQIAALEEELTTLTKQN